MGEVNSSKIAAVSSQKAIALLCFENERPLQGLIGKLDWRYNGAFTRLLRDGTITGQKNELSYVPFKWNNETLHFLILGYGENSVPGKRSKLSDHQVKFLKEKATALGLSDIQIEGDEESNGN